MHAVFQIAPSLLSNVLYIVKINDQVFHPFTANPIKAPTLCHTGLHQSAQMSKIKMVG